MPTTSEARPSGVRRLVVFGLSLSSSWGNGHATTYRGLLPALAARGWQTTFFEWDAPWYRAHRDLTSADACDLRLYPEWDEATRRAADAAVRAADAVLVGSYERNGIAILDWLADHHPDRPLLYYDIDTPITLAALREQGAAEYLRADQVPKVQVYFSFTGGPVLRELEERWRAGRAVALYCAVDPAIHRPVAPEPRFQCLLGYMGTYAADRQPKLEHLLIEPARALPEHRFLIAGPQYPPLDLPSNVAHVDHVAPPDHAAFYASGRATLNLTRDAMVAAGWSPSVRLFEAAACGACVVSDPWPGFDAFLPPGREALLVRDGAQARQTLDSLAADPALAQQIGAAARARVLAEHTFAQRAETFDRALVAAGIGGAAVAAATA